MTINIGYSILVIAVAAGCTILTRFLPFIIFGSRPLPKWLKYLGGILPAAIMGTLVVYCLKDTAFTSLSGWMPQLAAGAVTALLHIWKHNTFLSISVGTVLYMVLIRVIA